MSDLKKHINAAASAKANLHGFGAIIGILEAGVITGGGSAQTTSDKIIKLCKAENQRQLRAMDAAIDAAHNIKEQP